MKDATGTQGTEPLAEVHVTHSGTFAVAADGTRLRLPDTIASRLVSEGHGHSAVAPLLAPPVEVGAIRTRASDMALKRDPQTGRYMLAKSDGEVVRSSAGKLTYAEQMTRKEIARCLRQRGHSKREALVWGLKYIQHERFVTMTLGFRGDDAGRLAVDGAWHASQMTEIWRMCGHDKLYARSDQVTDSPLDDLTKAEPSAA